MKTDTIFYRLFQTFPNIFFELLNQPQEANAYQFSSVEVKQLAFRIDGVFIPTNAPHLPIYFAEVQFQPDKKFYSRCFAEIFNYLAQTELSNDWRSVVIFPTRSVDTGATQRYVELLNSQRVTRIYLNELGSASESSIGIETLKLIIEPNSSTEIKARELIDLIKREINNAVQKRELVELIETILIYKFPQFSREEIEQMLGLSELKQTRVYQEALEEGKLEGKLEAVPYMLTLGATVEQISQALGLDIELVQQAAAGSESSEDIKR